MVPEAPDKVWFKIGEAALRVGATPKELRYWEKVIPELQPRRSKGNLRYYHLDELARLQSIRQRLAEGFTVSDCRELFLEAPVGSPQTQPQTGSGECRFPEAKRLQSVLKRLRVLHARLGVLPGENLPADAFSSGPPSPVRRKKTRPVPMAGTLLLEPEVAFVEGEVPGPATAPKRLRRPKPDGASQDSMWSGGRLLLDAEE